MKTTKKATAPTKRENAAPKATQEKKPTAEKPTTATTEKATPTTTTAPQEAPTAPATKKEEDTMKDTTPTTPEKATQKPTEEKPDTATAAVTAAAPTAPARRYTADEVNTPQAAEALHRVIIRAAANAEEAPTPEQLETYETKLRAEAAAIHGKAPRWTESHALARLCYQLGLSAEAAAKAKTKTDNKKALVEAAKGSITPELAWGAVEKLAADKAAQKAIYQMLADTVEGMATTTTLYKAYLEETRKGGEAAGVLPTKSEVAKERAALRRAIDRRAKQRQAAEAIYYRHFSARLEAGEEAKAAKAAAMVEAAAYLRDDLALTADEAKAVWEEAAKAYIPDPAFNADKATK